MIVPRHIRLAADTVATDHRKYVEAKMAKNQQEDELLDEVLRIVQPALPALCSIAGVPARRALWLPDRILLNENGTFSNTGPGQQELDRSQVLERISVVDILIVLSAALSAQAGARTKVTEQIHREARTIESILLALRMGGIK